MKILMKVIFKFVGGLIVGLVEPIIEAVTSIIPNASGISTALTSVLNFLNWLFDFVLFVLSWLPFTSQFWAFFISVIIFSISITITLDLIKLVVKWWHMLVP